MNNGRTYQSNYENDYDDDIILLSNSHNTSYEYRNDIRRDLLQIRKGIQEERKGLKDILKNSVRKGIREVADGIEITKEGLEELVEDLKDVELSCRERRDINRAIKEIEDGLDLASKGLKDICRGNFRRGVRELREGIKKEEEGFEKLVKILADIKSDCNCNCNYNYDNYYSEYLGHSDYDCYDGLFDTQEF